ncbi:MAG: hypothetical protein HUK02_06925, partial [Bacteroidaceae bacterium]|nr:hypothetical protein [Bacteroidaceae bacterium]
EKNRIFDAHVYLGYRLGPVQSLRLMTTYYRTPEGLERNHFTMGELDYMLDFTNLWSGYQPQRRFRMGGFLGMGVRYIDANNGQTPTRREQFPDKTALFGTAGLDFRYNFTPQLSVYVEPYGALAYRGTQGAVATLFGGVRGGFQVDFLDTHIYTPRRAASESDREAGRLWRRRAWNHWFVQGAGGLDFQHEEHGEARNFLLGTVGIGYRFTPVQAVRLQAGAFNVPKQFEHQRTRLMGAVDYMLNLSNLFNGYRPDRRVNVIGFAGVGMRYLKFNDNDLERLAWMGRAGLDVAVRVHKGVSVYAEPFVGIARQRKQGQRYYTFDYGATAGLAVDLENAHYYGRRMPGRETVEDWPTRPWQRMYVMTGAGLKGSLTSATAIDRFYPFSGSLGYRFSPNESLRGRLTFNKSPRQSGVPSYLEGQIDYVLNVSNLLYGYRPERCFSLSGFAGAGLRRFSGSGSSDGRWEPKVDAGLDLALRIKRGLSVYVEPSVAVASDPHSKNMALTLGAEAGLALTFNDLIYYRARVGGHPEQWQSPAAERLFFGAMGGYQHIQEQSDAHAFPLTVLAGYQFSPVHALRARLAYTLSDENIAKRQKWTLGVDYLFSLRHLIGGYRPHARFDILGLAGVGLRRMELSTSAKDRPSCWRPTAMAGLDFRYKLTRNMSVFAEPYVGLVQSAHDRGQWQGMAGVNAGLVFDLHEIDQPYGPDSVRVSHTPFFETAHGWTFANGGGFKAGGLSLDGRMGLWLDPVFGLRFGLAAQHFYYRDGDGAMSGGKVAALLAKGRAELLLNPLNARADWRRKAARRRFDLNLSAGLEAGTVSKNRVTETTYMLHYTAVGVTAAVQGLYRVTPSTSLFLEPRFEYLTALNRGAGYQQEIGGQMTDHLFTLNAGVRVTRPSAELRRQQSPLHFVPHFFAGATVGGYRALASSKLQGGNLGAAGTVSAGYHFTPLHALKASYVPSYYHTQDSDGRYRLTDYRLLYMLNFSHLYQGVGERRLDVYVQGGPSFSLLRGDARNTSLGGALGFSVHYHVNRHVSVVTEPVGQFYLRSGFLPGTISPMMARLRVELNLGVNYNF